MLHGIVIPIQIKGRCGMIEERRKHIRFPVMRNVGEPIELKVLHKQKKISIPGYILNLSAGGMGIVTLGSQPTDLLMGSTFILDLKLPKLESHNVEGKIVRHHKARKALMHHSNEEWFVGLMFTKIKQNVTDHINRMAEDWSLCETKIEMGLPDICFRECAYWDICEKSVKLQDGKNS